MAPEVADGVPEASPIIFEAKETSPFHSYLTILLWLGSIHFIVFLILLSFFFLSFSKSLLVYGFLLILALIPVDANSPWGRNLARYICKLVCGYFPLTLYVEDITAFTPDQAYGTGHALLVKHYMACVGKLIQKSAGVDVFRDGLWIVHSCDGYQLFGTMTDTRDKSGIMEIEKCCTLANYIGKVALVLKINRLLGVDTVTVRGPLGNCGCKENWNILVDNYGKHRRCTAGRLLSLKSVRHLGCEPGVQSTKGDNRMMGYCFEMKLDVRKILSVKYY